MQRVELSLDGLPADRVESVTRELRATEGVREAILNPITARAALEFDPRTVRAEALVRRLETHGALAGERLARWHVPLPDLTCARCAARIEEELSRLRGVDGVTVNRAAESVTVEYIPSRTELDPIRQLLASRGFVTEAASDALSL